MKGKHILLFIQLLIAFAFQSIAQTASQPVQYKLTLDPDGTYRVLMKSITGYTGNNAKIGTAQVSLVVPTGTNFQITNLTGANAMTWTTTFQTRINNPSVGGIPTGKDYINFNYTNSTNLAFDITANTDIELFSFKNSSACAGPIMLWDVSDVFQVPNTDNFNVGNQITIFGAGFGNRWNSNYGTSPVPCNAPPTPNLAVSITPPATLTQNSPATFAVNVSNTGTGPTVGTTTVTTPLPAGMTFTGSSGTGWTCSQIASDVVCTNPNAIPVSSNSPLNITLTPTQTSPTSISTTVSGGGDATPTTVTSSSFTVNPAVSSCLVEYKITLEADGSYKVWMRPNTTFTGSAATIGTAQVTAVFPLPSGGASPVITNLTSFNSMGWTTNVAQQVVQGNFFYAVFSFSQASNPTVFNLTAGQEYPLFTFKNTATCYGPINLWTTSDPFQVPNGINFNVGNQISINGAGIGNKWCTNYGSAAACPVVLSPNITSTTTVPASTTVGVPTTISINIANTGTGPTTTPLTVTTPIPAGMTFTGSTGTGWTCNQVGSNVVCTNPNPVPAGGTAPLGVIFTPTQAGTPSIQTTTTGGGLVNPIVSPTATLTVNPVAGNPILAISATAPATATQNVPYNYSVNVSNTGTAPTTGNVSVTLPLPSGFNYTGATGTGWSCSQVGTNVTCNNPNAIATGGSSPLSISVNPTIAGTISTFAYASGGGTPTTAFSTLVSTTISPAVTLAPNVVITSVTNPSTATTGSPINLTVNLSNIGTAPSNGGLTFTSTLPAGVNFSSVNNGWTCSQVAQQLTCTNPSTLNNGSTSTLNIQLSATSPISFTPSGTLSGNGVINGGVIGSPIVITNPASGCTATDCGIGVRYGIKLSADGKTYTVYMKSATAFTGGSARIGTAQVTLKVPHGTGLNRFIPTNVAGIASTGNMTWTTSNGSRVDAPSIDINNDYIFFGFSQASSPALFDILANVEYPLFSFQNVNTCSGTVGLWETTDPFQAGFQSLNPGNQMTILGNGTSNAWKCNYTCAMPCQLPADLTISVTQPTPTLSVGQTSTINLTVTNLSNAANGQITVTTTLPAGVSTPSSSFAVGTWSCTTVGQIVTCTNPNTSGMAQNASMSLALPVVPSSTNAGQLLTFGFNVSSIATDSNLTNNTVSLTTTTPVTAPNLSINIAPFTLYAGQSSNVTVNVVNSGTINVNGQLTATITLPGGATAPASFSSNGWVCTTSLTTITCVNPNASSLLPNVILPIIVPVSTPANAASGQIVTINASITPVLGESNTTDNSTSGSGQLLSGANIKVVKSTSSIASQGTPFDYIFTVSNIGGVNSSSTITITDTLRSGLKYVSAVGTGWTCSKTGVDAQNNDIVQCTSSTIHLANAANSSTFTLRVNPTLATTTTNTAYVTGGGMSSTTPKPSSPCATCAAGATSVFVQAVPNISIITTQPTPIFVVGQPSVITININNTGGVPINTPITTTILLPTGITMPASFTNGAWTCTTSGQLVTCTNPNTSGVPVGGSLAINLTITPPITLLGQTPSFVINVLQIPGQTNTSGNTFTLIIQNPIAAPLSPDLTIVLNQPTPSMLAGQTSTMNVVVSNIGQGTATGQLTVTMPIPNGITMNSGSSNGWTLTVNAGILTATHPNTSGLAFGGSMNFLLTFTPNSSIVNTQPTFIAIVNTAPFELNTFNNTAILITNMGVSVTGVPNMTISAVLNTAFIANIASVFNVHITNNGVVPATGVLTTTIILPSGFSAPSSFTSNGWIGVTVGQTVTLTLQNPSGFPAGSISIIQVPVTPSSTIIGSTPSTFVFSINQVPSEIVTVDNVFYFIATSPVLGSAGPNITVNIISVLPAMTINQASNFTINFVNGGTQPQTGPLTMNIVLPSGMSAPATFTNNGWTCTLVGQTYNCTNPNSNGLPPNTNLNLIIPITPNSGLNGQIPGPIYIYTNGGSIPYIYTFTTPVAATSAPYMVVNVGIITSPMIAGQFNYIPVTIINNGSVNATGQLTLTINLPNGMSAPASFISGAWVGTTNGQVITLTYSNLNGLPPGTPLLVMIPAMPNNSLIGTSPSIIINLNTVPGQLITINNTFIYVVNPAIVGSNVPDLTITVSQPSPALTAGQASTITVNVQNIGGAIANGSLSVSFTLPNNFSTSTSNFTTGGWTCSVVGQTVTCTNPNVGGLAPSASSQLLIPIIPSNAAAGSTLSFILNVNTIVGEVNTVNNYFTLNVTTPVIINPNAQPNLNLVVTYNQSATYYQNTPFDLSFLVYNSSTMTSTGTITVRDTLRYGLKFISGSGFGWTINKVGVDAQGNDIIVATYNGTLSSFASTLFTLNVNPTLTGTIYNQAYISGGGMVILIKGSAPCIGCSISPTGPIIINQALNFSVAVKAILQGPYVASTGMMHDSLRVKNLIPLNNPYSTIGGFTQIGSGTETTTATILAVSGSNAIVDWVLIELRSGSNPSQILATKAGLIQRDGDVVSPADGVSPLQFTGLAFGSYYVAIRHRNHLGAMSANPVIVSATTATVDLTNAAQPAYKLVGAGSSNYPQFVSGSKAMLWAGNAVTNNQVIFQGPSNDVDMIFFTIISDPLNTQVISNFIQKGYNLSDVNMDGKTVFQGPDNEVDIIFFNVLMHPENPGFLANFIIWQQIP